MPGTGGTVQMTSPWSGESLDSSPTSDVHLSWGTGGGGGGKSLKLSGTQETL